MRDRKLLNSELSRLTPEEYRKTPGSGTVVVLDNIRSAHNVGSVFRSSDAFRIDKIYLCGICACPPSAEIHKSALGAEDSVRWEHRSDTLEVVRELKADGYRVVSIEQTCGAVQLQNFRREDGQRYALVFGNEVDGVQQPVVDESDLCIEIPQFGTKHSLNISVCAGIILWALHSCHYTKKHYL